MTATISAIAADAFNVGPRTNWIFVRVTASDGRVGVGEASLNGWEPLVLAHCAQLESRLAGRAIAAAYPALATYAHLPGGLAACAARSGVEQALRDLEGQAAGRPIAALLGGARRERVPVYANINRATADRSPDGCARMAATVVAQGFRAVKIAPFDGVLPDRLGDPETRRAIDLGVARVAAMRAAVGPDVRLMVDCHWRFDVDHALRVLDRLAALGLHWFECPVSERHGCAQDWATLHAATAVRGVLLAGCELQTGVAGFRPFIDPPLVDAIMPDVKYAGGIGALVDIAAAATAHGVRFSPHNPSGPIATQASLHAAAAAVAVDALELQVGESSLYDAIVAGALAPPVDGHFTVPTAPGLGLALDDATLRAHPYRPVTGGLDERLG